MMRIVVALVLVLFGFAVTLVLAQRRGPKVPEGCNGTSGRCLCYERTRTPEIGSLRPGRRREPTAHYLGAWGCMARWQQSALCPDGIS